MFADQHRPLPLRLRLCAAVLVFAVFSVGLAAVSPRLHVHAHHHGECESTTCAAALFAHGLVPLAPAPVLAAPVRFTHRQVPAAVARIVDAAPALRLPPPCGPPRV